MLRLRVRLCLLLLIVQTLFILSFSERKVQAGLVCNSCPEVLIRNAASGEIVSRTYAAQTVAFDRSGRVLATTNGGWITLRSWQNKADTKPIYVNWEGHSAQVNSLAFSPDGALLASGADDKTIKVWEAT